MTLHTLTFDERVRRHEAERAQAATRRCYMPIYDGKPALGIPGERDIVAAATKQGHRVTTCPRCDGPVVHLRGGSTAVKCVRCGVRGAVIAGGARFKGYAESQRVVTVVRRQCASCGREFSARRDAKVCGARCRKRRSRRTVKTADVTHGAAA